MDDSRNSLAAGARGEVAMIGAQRPVPHLTHRPRWAGVAAGWEHQGAGISV